MPVLNLNVQEFTLSFEPCFWKWDFWFNQIFWHWCRITISAFQKRMNLIQLAQWQWRFQACSIVYFDSPVNFAHPMGGGIIRRLKNVLGGNSIQWGGYNSLHGEYCLGRCLNFTSEKYPGDICGETLAWALTAPQFETHHGILVLLANFLPFY